MYARSILVVAFFAFGHVHGHTYHLGVCPQIEPQLDFNMNRMLGLWHVIQKTSTASTCITYNFTKTDEPDKYELEQTSQHFILGLTPLEHQYKYTGTLTVPDTAVPARMAASFPLNYAGSASYTVFMTDYDHYAAIFSCQKLTTIAHRQSATILSREKTLDKMYVDKIRMRLSSYNIDPFDLSIVSQKNCPKNGANGTNINIDDDTFSAHSVAGVVKKAGEKIGDGIEYVAGGSKKLYEKATSKEEINDGSRDDRKITMDHDAEWLP